MKNLYFKSNLDQLSREREKQSSINKANENVEIMQDYVSHFLEYASGNNTNLYLYPDQSAPVLDIINGEVLIYNVVMDRNKEFKKWALVEYVDSTHYPLMYNHIGYVLESDLKYEIKEKSNIQFDIGFNGIYPGKHYFDVVTELGPPSSFNKEEYYEWWLYYDNMGVLLDVSYSDLTINTVEWTRQNNSSSESFTITVFPFCQTVLFSNFDPF